MWIFRYTYCLLQGHAFVDITQTRRPYQYCLHCGKIKEPQAFLKNRELHSCADHQV
jgi:hypothetical protein